MLSCIHRLLLLIGSVSLAFIVPASAQVATPISKVPFTINKPGSYMLKRDLTFSATTGNAITVAADDVTLDLGGHVLTNTAGPATTAVGIFGEGRNSVTIRNGTIRGFRRGINLIFKSVTDSRRHLVANVNVDRCVESGIRVYGNLSTVRDCTITETSDSAEHSADGVFGIIVAGDESAVIGSDVLDTHSSKDSGCGIQATYGDGTLIEGNRIRNTSDSHAAIGISVRSAGQCFINNNRIANFSYGIYFNGATGKYRDNIVIGCTSPYAGGTTAGNNQ